MNVSVCLGAERKVLWRSQIRFSRDKKEGREAVEKGERKREDYCIF